MRSIYRGALVSLFAMASVPGDAAEPCNIVVILADDLGYGDPGCYNVDSKIPTPHLDRLAAGGLRFTDAHTPSSVCTPTRYTLLTGRYCWRSRLHSGVLDGFSPPLIEADRPTIATFLRDQGYATACLGKWHLGMQWTRTDGALESEDRGLESGFRAGDHIDFEQPVTGGPLAVGFDSFFGISASLDMPPYCWINNDRCAPPPDSTVPTTRDDFLSQTGGRAHSAFQLEDVLPTLKRRTEDWIAEHRRRHPDQPFLLYLPLNSPHLPVVPSERFSGTSRAGTYGDFVVETDDFVGGVLAALEDADWLENTLIVFTSDNGGLWHRWEPQAEDDVAGYRPTARGEYTARWGHQSNGLLRGTKADIYEGGHRVPFIVHWPASIKSPGVVEQPIELTDLFATLADVVGVDLPGIAAPDSFSFAAHLGVERPQTPPRPILVHHSLRGLFAIRVGDWKYVTERGSGGFSVPRQITPRPGEPVGQLYYLASDPQETRNLWNMEPDRVARMAAQLAEIRAGSRLRPDEGAVE